MEKSPPRRSDAPNASRARTPGGAWLAPIGVAALVFCAFAAYAFLSPSVYRATAVVTIQPVAEVASRLPPPLEAARRLHDAVLDSELLEQAAQPGSSSADVPTGRLRDALEIDTIDARTFNVSLRDSSAQRAQESCNSLARRAAAVMARSIGPVNADDENDRGKKLDALIAFLGSHADVAPAKPAASAAANVKEDATIMALRNERMRLSQRIESAPPPGASDNPYDDPPAETFSADVLRRRIAEIDRVLAARRQGSERATPATALPDDVQREWRTLLQGLADTSAPTADGKVASLNARVARQATLPVWPIEPNRKLVLFVGFLTSLGAAGVVVVARGAVPAPRPARRRSIAPVPLRAASEPAIDRPGATSGLAHPSSSEPPAQVFAAQVANARSSTVPNRDPRVEPDNPGGTTTLALPNGPIIPRTVIGVAAEPIPFDRTGQTAPVQRAPGRGKTRVTQVLGSPMGAPEVVPATVRIGSMHPLEPSPSDAAGGPDWQPGVANPPEARPDTTSSVPPGRTSSAPPRATARIEPLDVSNSFRPDSSLAPNSRRGLRDALLPFSRQTGFVIAVFANPESRDQKSRLCAELALSLSSSSQIRLLLVDGDFERPNVQRLLRVKVPMVAGFSLQLQTRARDFREEALTVLHCSRQLDALMEGEIRSPDALVSPQFRACLAAVKYHYDFVIIDGPLLTQEERCVALDEVIDGVVVVSERDEASTSARASALFSQKAFFAIVPA